MNAVYDVEDLLDENVITKVFRGESDVVTSKLQDIHCWSFNMHRAIQPHEVDFYEQLGWMVLFLLSDQPLWFQDTDPLLVFWGKCTFLNDHPRAKHLALLHQYINAAEKAAKSASHAIDTATRNQLLQLLRDAVAAFKSTRTH